MSQDRCGECGFPRKEHSANGACYGLCGEFVERYISKSAQLTAYQREILIVLAEECSEVSIAASKILRFGLDDHDPAPGSELNSAVLGREMGELCHMFARIITANLIDPKDVARGVAIKRRKLAKYLQSDPPWMDPK